MKKTLITLAALAASVASAATLEDASINLQGDTLVAGDTAAFSTAGSYTMTVVLDWETAMTSLGNWSAPSYVMATSGHNTENWWTHGLGLIQGAGDHAGSICAFVNTDNKNYTTLTGTEGSAPELIEYGHYAKFTQADYSVEGKLALTLTYTADSDPAKAGNQAALTLYALKNDGSLVSAYTIHNNEWSYDVPFNRIAELTANTGIEQVLAFDSVLSASDIAAISTAAVTPATPAVPEPTTATLSLLALAGLAARRRRK